MGRNRGSHSSSYSGLKILLQTKILCIYAQHILYVSGLPGMIQCAVDDYDYYSDDDHDEYLRGSSPAKGAP